MCKPEPVNDRRHIILIAGPASSGKTCLINGILKRRFSGLRDQLGISDPATWQRSSLRNINDDLDKGALRLLVHCDLYNAGVPDRIEKQLLGQDHVTTLTLRVSAHTLITRNRGRIDRELLAFMNHPWQQRRRLKKLYSLCKRQIRNRDERKLCRLYMDWFSLLSQNCNENFWLENDIVDDTPVAVAFGHLEATPCKVI